MVSEGPICEAICFCRSTSNTPVRIIIESYSPGLRVELLPANDESNSQRIRVAVKANANGGRDTLFVRLIATVGTVKTSLEIPITIEGYSPK